MFKYIILFLQIVAGSCMRSKVIAGDNQTVFRTY